MLGVTFVLANATPGSYANNAGNVSHVNVCVYLTGPADNTQCSPLHRNGGWRRWYLYSVENRIFWRKKYISKHDISISKLLLLL